MVDRCAHIFHMAFLNCALFFIFLYLFGPSIKLTSGHASTHIVITDLPAWVAARA